MKGLIFLNIVRIHIQAPRLGWVLDRELAAIALVYFGQGALGLAQLAVSFFLKDELGLSPSETAALLGIVMLPWTVKPLYGLVSDSVPLWGYRRRSYMVVSSLLGAIAWGWLAVGVHAATQATIAIALTSLAVACSDAIADAAVVERARRERADAGSLQSFTWAAASVGTILSAYLGGVFLEWWGSRTVFAVTAVLPLLTAIAALAIAERAEGVIPVGLTGWREQWRKLRQAFTQKEILLPAVFLFLWQATPTADSAFFFFTTNELHFNPEFLGTVRLVTNVAGLVGIWLFQRYLRGIPIRRIFVWTTLLSAGLGLTGLVLVTHANRALGIDDRWFSLGDSVVLAVAGRIAFMPVLVLAARLCPPGIEATLFALLMSVLNLGSLVAYQLGAWLTQVLGVTETDFTHLPVLLIVANLSTLLPLPLAHWLPEETAQDVR